MFEKKKEEFYNNEFYKFYYISKEDYNIINLLEDLQNNGMQIRDIKIKEDADIGLKTFEGHYSLSDFYKKYSQINKEEINSIFIEFSNNKSRIGVTKDGYIGLFSVEDIELEDLVGSKPLKL